MLLIKKISQLLSLFLLAVILTPALAGAAGWVKMDLDQAVIGNHTDIFIDRSNAIHILYNDGNDLRFISNRSGAWVNDTIYTDTGLPTGSIVVDRTGVRHISFYDQSSGNILRYAVVNDSSGLTTFANIDTGNAVGPFNASALDSNDKLHVSYWDSVNFDLKYATNASGSWVTGIVDNDPTISNLWGSAIALDDNDNVYISYNATVGANRILKYAVNKGGVWTRAVVANDTNTGKVSSLAVDANGHAHIAYFNATANNLRYATNANDSWVSQVVDNSGTVSEYCSLAANAAGTWVAISYFDSVNQELEYAVGSGSNWTLATIDDDGNVGRFSALALDSLGYPYISYLDGDNNQLKLIYYQPDVTLVGGGGGGCFVATAVLDSPTEKPASGHCDSIDRITVDSGLGLVTMLLGLFGGAVFFLRPSTRRHQ